MKKRILKTLAVAVVIGIAIPVQVAVARPMGDTTFELVSVKQSSPPIVSEKLAGLDIVTQSSGPIVSEKLAGLNIDTSSSSPVVSEIAAGFSLPSGGPETIVSASGTNGFDWGDAGIGAGVLAASMLAFGSVLMMRRRHTEFAH